MGKLFKGVAKAAGPVGMAASAFGEMANQMGIMDAIMGGLQPLFDIINSLMSVLSSSIMQALMPALQPLIDLFPVLIPLIQQIGGLIGQSLAIPLQIFTEILVALMPLINALMPLFITLMEIGFIPLQLILEILTPILEDLEPVIALVSEAVVILTDALEVAIGWVTDFIDVIIMGFKGDAIHKSVVEEFIETYFPELIPEIPVRDISRPPAYVTGGVQEFQHGTPLITRTGLATLHAGEEVKPAGLVGRAESLLEEILFISKQQIEQERRNVFFNRRRKR